MRRLALSGLALVLFAAGALYLLATPRRKP